MLVGEDDGGEIGVLGGAAHGQLRERAVGEEMLQGHAVMRLFMRDGADHGGLAVFEAGDRDTGLRAQLAVAAIRRHDQPRGEFFRADGDVHLLRAARDDGLRGCPEQDIGALMEPTVDRDPQAARLDNPAEGRVADGAVVEMQLQGGGRAARLAVRHVDIENRAGGKGQGVPQPGFVQQPPGPGGDGVGPAIEIRMLHRRQGGFVHQQDLFAARRQGAGQSAAHRAGADDRDVVFRLHGANVTERGRTAKQAKNGKARLVLIKCKAPKRL